MEKNLEEKVDDFYSEKNVLNMIRLIGKGWVNDSSLGRYFREVSRNGNISQGAIKKAQEEYHKRKVGRILYDLKTLDGNFVEKRYIKYGLEKGIFTVNDVMGAKKQYIQDLKNRIETPPSYLRTSSKHEVEKYCDDTLKDLKKAEKQYEELVGIINKL